MCECKERFFYIKKDTDLYNEYMEFKNFKENIIDIVYKLSKEFNLEFNYFIADTEYIAFDNLIAENSKFLCINYINGFRAVRKKSKLFKRYKELVKIYDLKKTYPPIITNYFSTFFGKHKFEIFNDELYLRLENCKKSKNKDDYVEIKGSEFYKILEQKEEQ